MDQVTLVVLVCDISGFMRLARSLGARMPEFVQRYYETAGDAVVASGGSILKYMGDSILCVFPAGREKSAVRCAIRMREAFAALLARHAPGEGARLEAAVSCGPVTRGLFGHPSLQLDDVMGEAVAHAAVLNRVSGINVTDQVRAGLGAEFRLAELPPVPLKWSSESLRAWQVLP